MGKGKKEVQEDLIIEIQTPISEEAEKAKGVFKKDVEFKSVKFCRNIRQMIELI